MRFLRSDYFLGLGTGETGRNFIADQLFFRAGFFRCFIHGVMWFVFLEFAAAKESVIAQAFSASGFIASKIAACAGSFSTADQAASYRCSAGSALISGVSILAFTRLSTVW